jgi:carboxylesterase type B
MQTAAAALGERLVEETDEDCLSLNVWTPAVDDRRRPVLVWVHGGGFMVGAGSQPVSRGAALAQRGDVVVVTINYRPGLFGYLRGIDVCGEAIPSTGNAGLLDQLAALTWVNEEIAAFGGDPENVTVFGSSAGALSIGLMLAMPRARGLFQKAIMQSPPAFSNSWGAPQLMEAILADIGLAPSEAGRLPDLPAAQLLDIQTRLTPRSGGVAYGPVADGTDLPSDPETAIAGGSAAGIPLLIGTNLEEYKFFRRMDGAVESLTDETLLARLADPRTTAEARDKSSVNPAEAVALYPNSRFLHTLDGKDEAAYEVRTFRFGALAIDGVTYDYDVIIDRGHPRKRSKKASKPFRSSYGHTPLSEAEDIRWRCRRLAIGSGAYGALPLMPEVEREAKARGVELAVMPTGEAIRELSQSSMDTISARPVERAR